MDMYNSEIISYRISKRPNTEGIMENLEKAISQTNGYPYCRIFHSDQGWALSDESFMGIC